MILIFIILQSLCPNIEGCSLILNNLLSVEQSEREYTSIKLNKIFQMEENQNFRLDPKIEQFELVDYIRLVEKVEMKLQADPLIFKLYKVEGQVVPLSYFIVFDGINFYYSQELFSSKLKTYPTSIYKYQDSLDCLIIDSNLIFDQSQQISTIFSIYDIKNGKEIQYQFAFRQSSLNNILDSLGQNIYRSNYQIIEKFIQFNNEINYVGEFEKVNNDECGEASIIQDFKIHINGRISLIDQNSLAIFKEEENNFEQISCFRFDEKILTYDYDCVEDEYVVVLENRVQYKDQVLEIDFIPDKRVKVFLLKDYILLQLEQSLEVYDKQFKLVEQVLNSNQFLVQSNSLQNGFIMVDKNYAYKYAIQSSPTLNLKPLSNDFEIIKTKIIQSTAEKDCKVNLLVYFSNLDFSPFILMLKDKNLISAVQEDFEFCSSNLIAQFMKNQQVKLDGQNFYNYKFFKLIPTFDDKIRQFFIMQDYRNKIFIFYCNQNEKDCDSWETSLDAVELKESNNQILWVYNKVIYFAFYQFKAFQLYSCEVQSPQFNLVEKHKFNDQITLMTSNGNRLFFLILGMINIYKIEQQQIETSSIFQKEQGVKHIMASSIRPDYLFFFNEYQEIKLYKYYYSSEPTQIFEQEQGADNIKIVQFQDCFVLINNQKNAIYFQVFNYENEMDIFSQQKIHLDFLSNIDMDSIINNPGQNLIFFKGQLESNDQYIVVALRINTSSNKCLQLIVKAYAETQISTIFNYLILKFQDKITQIFEIDALQVCMAKTNSKRTTIDEYFDLDFEEDFNEFSASTFAVSTAAEELFIYGMYKLYGKKKIQYIDNYGV